MFAGVFSRMPFSRYSFAVELYSEGELKAFLRVYDTTISSPYAVNIYTTNQFSVEAIVFESRILVIRFPIGIELSIEPMPINLSYEKRDLLIKEITREVNIEYIDRVTDLSVIEREVKNKIEEMKLSTIPDIRDVQISVYRANASVEAEETGVEVYLVTREGEGEVIEREVKAKADNYYDREEE